MSFILDSTWIVGLTKLFSDHKISCDQLKIEVAHAVLTLIASIPITDTPSSSSLQNLPGHCLHGVFTVSISALMFRLVVTSRGEFQLSLTYFGARWPHFSLASTPP